MRRTVNRKFGQQINEDTTGVHPAMLKQARKSGQLNLSNRQLSQVPDTVWRINLDTPEEARSVSLDSEERWWDQVDLTKLILASNTITDLGHGISQLPALVVLDVHDNRLQKLPDVLGELVHLQRLNVSHNDIQTLPNSIGSLQGLQTLHVQHNKLTALPPAVCTLHTLEDLDTSNNQLTALPEGIGNLHRMMKLNIGHNHIHTVPHELGRLANLTVLDCTHNQIHTLPDELGDCAKLEQLYLRHNRLAHLAAMSTCAALKEVHLGNNQLQGIAAEQLEGLRNVSVLDLRDNRLRSLPEHITLLEQLQRLDISNNDISTLPYTLGTISSLKSIVLDGNPMKGIRRDIVMRGTQELKKYLVSRMEAPVEQARVLEAGGHSGVIGASTAAVDPHHVQASRTLEYSGKKAGEVPGELWPVAEQAGVTAVNLSKNALSALPHQLLLLKKTVSELNLGFNKIKQFDASLGQLSSLIFLDIRNNELSTLPEELANLSVLREINVTCNRFRVVPTVIYSLVKLEILLAGDNQIEDIDAAGMQRLPQLSSLDLRNNNITQVPPALGLCTHIRSLQLEGNPFRVPRPAILGKGTLAVLDYLRGRIPAP